MKSKGKEEIVKERERQKMTQYTKKRRKSSLGRIDIEGTHTYIHTHTHSLNWETMGEKRKEIAWEKVGETAK